MCEAQEEVLDICVALTEDGSISANQCNFLKHLVLIRDESIADIYNNYQKHRSFDRMAGEIFSYVSAHYEDNEEEKKMDDEDEEEDDVIEEEEEEDEEEEGDDESTNAAVASHLSASIVNSTNPVESLTSVLLELLRSGEIDANEGAELHDMIQQDNEYVSAAHEIFEADGDYDELKDTLIRCAKLAVRKKALANAEEENGNDTRDYDEGEEEEEEEEEENEKDEDEEEEVLSVSDLEGVDLVALLTSLGVEASWSSAVPEDFCIAVFAFAHTGVLTPSQASALCDLYDADYDLVRAAWEVFRLQRDLSDFIDTMLRVLRDVKLENQSNTTATSNDHNGNNAEDSSFASFSVGSSTNVSPPRSPSTSTSTATNTPQTTIASSKEAAVNASSAVRAAKQDLLKHSLEMMVKQGILTAASASGLFERSLEGDALIETAIESYAKDRNVTDFLDTLQVLASHTKEEIESILQTSSSSPASSLKTSSMAPPPASSSSSTIQSTLTNVVMQLAADNMMDEDSAEVLLSLIDSSDDRIFAIFQSFRCVHTAQRLTTS